MSHYDIICPECKKRIGGCRCMGEPRTQNIADKPCDVCRAVKILAPASVPIQPLGHIESILSRPTKEAPTVPASQAGDDDKPPYPVDREDYHDALRYVLPDVAERNAAIDRIMATPIQGAGSPAGLDRLEEIIDATAKKGPGALWPVGAMRDQINRVRASMAIPAPDMERMAEAVHDAYLVTCKRLGWGVKPENQVPYSALTEDSKELDRASVRAVLAALSSPGSAAVGGVPSKNLVTDAVLIRDGLAEKATREDKWAGIAALERMLKPPAMEDPSDMDPATVQECARLVGLWWRDWLRLQSNPAYYREADRVVDYFPEKLREFIGHGAVEGKKGGGAPAGGTDQAPAGEPGTGRECWVMWNTADNTPWDPPNPPMIWLTSPPPPLVKPFVWVRMVPAPVVPERPSLPDLTKEIEAVRSYIARSALYYLEKGKENRERIHEMAEWGLSRIQHYTIGLGGRPESTPNQESK